MRSALAVINIFEVTVVIILYKTICKGLAIVNFWQEMVIASRENSKCKKENAQFPKKKMFQLNNMIFPKFLVVKVHPNFL